MFFYVGRADGIGFFFLVGQRFIYRASIDDGNGERSSGGCGDWNAGKKKIKETLEVDEEIWRERLATAWVAAVTAPWVAS